MSPFRRPPAPPAPPAPPPPLDAIYVDTAGFAPVDAPRPGVRLWRRDDGDVLAIERFAIPPDLPPGASLAALRAFYDAMLAPTGGHAVAVRVLRVAAVAVVETVVLVPAPPGVAAVASLTLPFRDASFVVKLQCPPRGGGAREAVALDRRLAAGRPPPAPGEPWEVDDEALDAAFPDHPLSRARRHLAQVRASLHLAPELRALPPFPLPPPDEPRA